ncbi:MAG TPA: ATPase domain-containing protein [Kofleriaceae bacterium]|nr:ATPase domain-containing protein [Kofleriaceae bacterium]
MNQRVSTGIHGLDHVLYGGLLRSRLYLLEGDPGVGKTTLALQFLLAGVAAGERALYITLSETEDEIRAIAESHGWSLAGLAMFELSALEQQIRIDAENTIFRPSDVELTETTRALLRRVDEVTPDRVVFDSLSELRLLAQNPLRYRREVLNLKTYFSTRQCTVLLLDDRTSDPGDQQLQSLAHGVISMQQRAPDYGGDRRRLRVTKLRGAAFRGGFHDMVIEPGGVRVFPRLIAAEHHAAFERTPVSSGVAELDNLLGGGIDRGTSTLLIGGAGTGKSSIMAQYATAAAARGERGAIFGFDELRDIAILRADALGLGMSDHIASGRIVLQQVDPGELTPGELAHRAIELVEREHVKFIALDTLNGYLHAMPAEQHLYIQLHELLSYLGQRGVTTMLVMAQAGMVGTMHSPVDVSYIADNVLLLRYFEAEGRIRKAISVVKKRTGRHENSIRELSLSSSRGIEVGAPLTQFHGILTGVPQFHGNASQLSTK